MGCDSNEAFLLHSSGWRPPEVHSARKYKHMRRRSSSHVAAKSSLWQRAARVEQYDYGKETKGRGSGSFLFGYSLWSEIGIAVGQEMIGSGQGKVLSAIALTE
jgi:hypothetical protein